MNYDNQSIKLIRDLVGQNQLQEAINAINEVIHETKVIQNDKALINDLININGQLTSLKRSNDIGVLNHDEKIINENKLRNSILSFVQEFETKLNNDPIGHSANSKYGFKILTISLCFIALISGFCLFHLYSKADQKNWIKASGLIVMLGKNNQTDTIYSIPKLLKIVECEYRQGESYSLDFNLENQVEDGYRHLEISLKQKFIDDNNWQFTIEGWSRNHDASNEDRAIYIYDDLHINSATFEVGHSND